MSWINEGKEIAEKQRQIYLQRINAEAQAKKQKEYEKKELARRQHAYFLRLLNTPKAKEIFSSINQQGLTVNLGNYLWTYGGKANLWEYHDTVDDGDGDGFYGTNKISHSFSYYVEINIYYQPNTLKSIFNKSKILIIELGFTYNGINPDDYYDLRNWEPTPNLEEIKSTTINWIASIS